MARKAPNTMFNWGHLLGTILHLVQMSLAYLLMLVVMTFNTWLCLAVVLGSTLGYFLVGWKRPAGAIDVSDHCHWLKDHDDKIREILDNSRTILKKVLRLDLSHFKSNISLGCHYAIQRRLQRWWLMVLRAVLYILRLK